MFFFLSLAGRQVLGKLRMLLKRKCLTITIDSQGCIHIYRTPPPPRGIPVDVIWGEKLNREEQMGKNLREKEK
jgi:hypothetical protein